MSLSILCVDDQRFMLTLLRSLIQAKGHQVEVASSSVKALEYLQTSHIDILICDIGLDEEKDGLALLDQIRSMPCHAGLAIIILSRHDEIDVVQRAVALGADEYILKPVAPKRLMAALDRWSGLADTGVPWDSLSRDQAGLMRMTLGTVGHAFVQAHQGQPVSFAKTRAHALAVVRAGDDQAIAEALSALKNHDGRTYLHCMKMGAYLGLLGHLMDQPQERVLDLITAGLLHDIGYARIPLSVLSRPERTPAETAWLLKAHIEQTRTIVAAMDPAPPADIAEAMIHHHERLDGRGPLGVPGAKLTETARLAIVVNEFLVHRDLRRPDLIRRSDREIMETLRRDAGLDQAVVTLLDRIVGAGVGLSPSGP